MSMGNWPSRVESERITGLGVSRTHSYSERTTLSFE